MFVLEIEFLTGRFVATDRTERDAPEWPPHPGRLFSALTAAAFECFSDSVGNLEPAVKSALEWLETRASPPSLSLSGADPRDTVPVFVPVNDSASPDSVPKGGLRPSQVAKGLKVLPERRTRQQRSFPSVTLRSPLVYFVWLDAEPGEHHAALAKLSANVTYFGHSTSLVRVAVVDVHPPLTHQPDENGNLVLRVPSRGRLQQLADAYRQHSRPTPGMYRGYSLIQEPMQKIYESVFGDALVFRNAKGQPLPLRATLKLTSAVRDALMSHAGPTVPEVISGHAPDGQPSRRDHVAIVPLAFINSFYADGSLLGFAVVLPRELKRYSTMEDRRTVLTAVRKLNRLWDDSDWGGWTVEPSPANESRSSLQFEPQYVGPARRWASVTPIVCDRYPKDKEGQDLKCIIAESCVRIGLPPPLRVEAGVASPFLGVPPCGHFLRYPKDSSRGGHRVHAIIEFAEAVRGPVILGKNRYLGLGLMRPYLQERRRREGGAA